LTTCSHNVEFKKVGGAPPDLLLLNKAGEVIKRIDLSKYNREECNQLLIDLGFYKKSDKDEDVPEEFLEGPYKLPKEEL
ncbi:selenoprotein M-like, partial [Lingula anatina]|uniref:Selenoprotein M-like n=1 Tax=Lingula anatina TaxID=7574 RepID=A0A2R2MSK7_LINAN